MLISVEGEGRLYPCTIEAGDGRGHLGVEPQPTPMAWLQTQFDEGLNCEGPPAAGVHLLRRLPPHISVSEPLDLYTARCFGIRSRRHLAQLAMLSSEVEIEQIERGLRYVDADEAALWSTLCHQPVRVGYHHPPVEIGVWSRPWHVYAALSSLGISLREAFSAVAISRAEAGAFLRFEAPLSEPSARALTALLDGRNSGGPHDGPSAARLRRARRARGIAPEPVAAHCSLTLSEYLGLETGHRSFASIVERMRERRSPLVDATAPSDPIGGQTSTLSLTVDSLDWFDGAVLLSSGCGGESEPSCSCRPRGQR